MDCRVIFKDSKHLLQAGGMKIHAKNLFRSWKKKAGRAEIFGSGLVLPHADTVPYRAPRKE
jgi:hypothetical protein